jgi:hypothetical protein
MLIWLGLLLFGFATIFQVEGNYTPGRWVLIVLTSLNR